MITTELVGVVITSRSNNHANYYRKGETVPVLVSFVKTDIRNVCWGQSEERLEIGDCVLINVETGEIERITREIL